MDILGSFLKLTPPLRGKWRLQRFWERDIQHPKRLGQLPHGIAIATDLRIPYEREVWLQAEEWHDLLFLRTLLKPGDCFIDVGANIGLWTLVAADRVGEMGKVYAFEPNAQTFTKLQQNITRNQFNAQVEAFPKAVTARSQTLDFVCETHHNLSRPAMGTEQGKVVSVPAINLDSLWQESPTLPTVTGIKLDTEGGELGALQGANYILTTHAPWLVVEFNTTFLPSQRLADWAVYQFLIAQGYQAFRYDQRQQWAASPDFAIAGYTNILFQHPA